MGSIRKAALVFYALAMPWSLRASDPSEATITAPSGAVSTPMNQAVAFTATSTDSFGYDLYTVNSYSWAFGDGSTGASASTSHAYTTAGTYTVTLTVNYTGKLCSKMDQNGNCTAYSGTPKTATATRTITVLPPPTISSFSASSTSVQAGKPVTLSWATTNATSLSISGVGAVTGTSASVSPTTTTQYTLTATGGGGSATAAVTVSTYTLSVSISPGSATLLVGGSQAFTGTVNPANQGVSWSATGGTLSGSTFTATASGSYTVKVASVEDPTRTASATVTVAAVSVGTPVPVPATGQCYVGGTVSFTAQVAGAVDTSVTWSASGGGSINPTGGVFTGSAQGTYTVTATSVADPTRSASATVQVVPLVVTATPANPTVRSGQSQTLTATVTGPGNPDQGVTWTVVTPNGGAITTGGVYTAPATAGDYTVKATSTQDPTCSGTATIHVPGWVLVWKKDIVYLGTKEVAEVDATGKTWVTFDDHLGSPRYEWDGTANPVLGTNLIAQKYAPFGEYLNDPAAQVKFAKGFTNHEQTDPSGLIYMQARFYAPWYGRFLSPDPARDQHFEETQSWNIYSYVRNDPMMMVDATGEVAKIVVQGNTVKIFIPVRFGKGTPQAYKDQFVKSVQSAWTGKFGKYRVTTEVVQGSIDGRTNDVFVYRQPGRSQADTGAVHGDAYLFTGEKPEQAKQSEPAQVDPEVGKVMAHEAGHLMGLDDGYKDGWSADGKSVVAVPKDKKEQSGSDPNAKGKRSDKDIMVNEKKGRPTGADIHEALVNEKRANEVVHQ